jgi:hypothetical protein
MDASKVTEEIVFLCDECWASHCVQFDEPQPFMLTDLEKHEEVAPRASPET